MFHRIEVFFRRLRRSISRSEWAIRRLKLSTSEQTSNQPGVLLVQIDGLSRAQFERAIASKKMPFVRSLMKRQNYEIHTFYSGVPATTPAVQAELHYGVCCAVPAFSFVNRATRRVAAMFNPDWAKHVEGELAAEGEPLLKNGSSWSNIYTGGSGLSEAHFCAASIGIGDMLKSASPLGFLSILILQVPAVLRLIGLLFVEFFVALRDSFRGVFEGENFFKEFKFIFIRVFVCVGLREFIAVGARIDLARGLPIVHVNFLGYDEQSHRRGPESAFAHWSLGGIDYAIKRLYAEAKRSTRRDYQVWIFSDHGQETTHVFDEHYEGGVEAAIERVLRNNQNLPIARKIRARRRPTRGYWAGGKRVERSLKQIQEEEQLTPEEEESFSVAAMGPVGHLYLKVIPNEEEKRQLAKKLVKEGKIPGVLYKLDNGKAEWVHAMGTALLPDEGPELLQQPEYLKKQVSEDLVKLCGQKYAGDLVLLGWTPHGPPWTFAIERGAHAGPGPNETQGFLIVPRRTRLPDPDKEYVRPSDLRNAVFYRLGRQPLPRRRKRASEIVPHRLRIMTYNVHSCIGMDGRTLPKRIAHVIEALDPDVVALQEIDLGRERSFRHDQAKMISEEVGMHMHFCPTIVYGEEGYGHAILSRYPAALVKTSILPKGNRISGEPRGALWVKINVEGAVFNLISTHLGLGRIERMEQMKELLSERWIGGLELDEPVVMCGDFNMVPDSLPYRAATARLHDVQRSIPGFKPLKTFAALFPFTRIDHIFVSNHFQVEDIQVPLDHLTRVASDHLPLVTDVVFKLHPNYKKLEGVFGAEGLQKEIKKA